MHMFNKFSVFKAYSNKTAIVTSSELLTYKELDELSDYYAHQILKVFESKHRPLPKVIPIIGQRSAKYITSVLACWKLGVGIIPISHDTPIERIQLIFTDLKVKNAIRLDFCELPKDIEVVTLNTEKLQNIEHANKFSFKKNDIAYIIYTSGSTGKPKGCVVGRESLEPIVESFLKHYGIDNSSRVTFVANIAFDAAMLEWLPALLSGASVYIVDKDVLLNKERLIDFYHKNEITFSWLPTPLAESLMTDERVNLPSSLGVLQTAGQRLTIRPPSSWHTRVENAYGPTECTVIVSSSVVKPGITALPDIGQPLQGIECYIIDENHIDGHIHVLPHGESGELVVAGIGVSRGYYERDDLTKEAFFTLNIDGGKPFDVYATGDICRFNSQGNIEFIERKDKQVKLNGFRIELGDILANLLGLEEVEQAYVLCKKVGSQDILLAYVVYSSVNPFDQGAIKQKLQAKLPYYMIPSSIQRLSELPLTSNQKVDESKLPFPEVSSTERYSDLSSQQQAFLGIFNQHMGVTIGWDEDFFGMGGNSVTLISISAEVYRTFSLLLDFSIVHKFRSPAKIWCAIKNADSKQVVINENIDSKAKYVDLPLSSSQKSIWYLANTDLNDKAYHAKARLSLFGQVNSTAVERALQKVVDRNGIFRTAFIKGSGGGVQRVFRRYEIKLIQIDISTIPEAEKSKELGRLIQEDLNEPFNLEKLPLVRWALIKMNEQESVLVHIEHHLVHDGWSFNLFLKEFGFYYKQHSEKTADELPMPGQYGDYCITQKQWLGSQAADEYLTYWSNNLAGAALKINLPKLSTITIDKNIGTTLRFHLERKKWEAIELLAVQREETPFSILLSIYYLMLQRFSGDNDICIGSAFANRQWVNADSIIGMMINTVVLRSKLYGEMSISELLSQVSKTVLDAQNNQVFPFEYLIKQLNPEREPGVNPLFQVFFGFHDSPMPKMDLPGIENFQVFEAIDSNAAKFDLSVVVIPRKDQVGEDDPVHMLWEFKKSVFPQWLVESMINVFCGFLDVILCENTKLISQLPVEANRTKGKDVMVSTSTIYQRFRSQALLTPNSIAISCGQKDCTYSELLHITDSRAAYIQQLGVESGLKIGIYLSRSIESVAWMLACQAVGVCYIPLDPMFPEERINYIIEHSDIKFVVSDQPGKFKYTIPRDIPSTEFLTDVDIDMTSAMYCLYTSGSTGNPKGVIISHHAFANFIDAMDELLKLREQDVWLALTSFSFDISTLEIYLPLIKGVKVILTMDEENKDANALKYYLNNHSVSHCQATTSIWKTLVSLDWKPTLQQTILCGGEAMDEALSCTLGESAGEFFNMYGPTETTVWSSYKQLGSGSEVSLGSPINNTELLILDDSMNNVPKGAIGELWISGVSLATGYLNNPELTEERFVVHPCTGQRMYRTGDLASLGTNYEIKFHGRSDQQVKVSGYRVELEEVEQVIKRMDTVRQVAVVVRSVGTIEQIVAYVESLEGVESEIIRYCQRFLASYMVPSRVLILKEFPLTPNGKIDREALPDIHFSSQSLCYPETDTEKKLAKIVAQQMNHCELDIMTHFYKLGVNSLMAMKICFEIENEFNAPLKVLNFIVLGNIKAVASHLDMSAINVDLDEFSEEFRL